MKVKSNPLVDPDIQNVEYGEWYWNPISALVQWWRKEE